MAKSAQTQAQAPVNFSDELLAALGSNEERLPSRIEWDHGTFAAGYAIIPISGSPVPRREDKAFAMNVREMLVKRGAQTAYVTVLPGGYAICIRTPKTAQATAGAVGQVTRSNDSQLGQVAEDNNQL